jgi:hypothetical protein
MRKSPYLCNFPVIHTCSDDDCEKISERLLIMVEKGEAEGESIVSVRFFCNEHASIIEAMFVEENIKA